MRKALLALLVAVFVLASCQQQDGDRQASQQDQEQESGAQIQNPNTFVYGAIGDPDSLDPSKAYDSASFAVMSNVYESLLEYEGTSTSELRPVLAAEIPTVENGGISEDGTTYRFRIREGVTFHNGNELTPEDVEYTFERNMVVDAAGGPNWVWYTYLLDKGGSGDVESFSEIDNAVEVDGQYVVFNLPQPFPPFLNLVADTWASVVDKEWVVEQGGWPGTADTWQEYNKPGEGNETLYDIANGTGPYQLERWEKDTEVVLSRYGEYWGEQPAMERGIYRVVPEWSTRRLMLIQGDADAVYVPTQYYQSMAEESGIKVSEDLDTLNVEGIHFNYEIQAQDNPLVGSGQLDGNGVPSDFFQDRNVRLGFAHAMDQETLINEALNGFGRNPVTPVPYGIPFKDTELESRAHDIEAATEAFKKAHGGQVWEQGFQLEILYNEGNDRRQLTARILAENINSINDKFNVTTRAVPWADYLDRIRNSTMPVFIIGWAPDYPDPDNYVTPFMHSTKGTFAAWAHYENKEVDQLIDEAGTTLDADRREEIYYQLQETYLEEIVSVMTNQQVEQRYYRDWVEGNFYNPMQADPFELLPHIEKSS